MYLSKLSIQNFRSIKDVTIDFQKDLNVFVGKNNTGKSSIIDAIRLALGTSMNNPNPIWISEDDFYKGSYQQNREESFTIKMEFADLNEKQRVKFFEIVDFDLANINDSIAKLEYNASWPLKNGSRVSVKRTGGPEGPEKSEVPQKIMEQFSVIYLPALRDAETALTAGNKSQLATLLKNLANDENKQNIEQLYNDSNEKLSDNDLIKNIINGINDITKSVAASDAQKSKILAANSDFTKILRTLQVQMDGNPVEDLYANGLGSNNLLYIAVVLQYLKSIGEDECPVLLIEEPEAHLHPQMVLSLSRYLSENLTPQTIITTHSPTLVTDIPIDKIYLLFKKENSVCCNALRNANFNDSEKKQFSRLMDITRSTLYFAKGVILVEGISEAILLPVLAQRMGIDLRKKQISVIPICGVSFEIFKKIFNEKIFEIPVAIITDGDPKITYPPKSNNIDDDIDNDEDSEENEESTDKGQNWRKAYINWESLKGKKICSRTKKLKDSLKDLDNIKVFNSSITFEYDLARVSKDNALVISLAWERCFKGRPKLLNTGVINGLPTRKAKAEHIWRVVCLSKNKNGPGKGDLASNLALLLDEKNTDANPSHTFIVPPYIQKALKFVDDRVK